MSTPDSQPTPDEERVAFLEAAGCVRRDGRVYGLGSESAIIYAAEIHRPSIAFRVDNSELRRENNELR